MVERVTLILDSFDAPTTRLTLEEVSCRAGLPRSTVHRILDQLVKLDWIEHASFGYCLGRRSLGFGADPDGHARIREAAAPVLHTLHMRTGLVVHLSVLDGGDGVYLDKIGGKLAAALPSRVGGRVPAHATACGKALLAWLDPESVDDLYRHEYPRRATERTIGDVSLLHQELGRIRRRHGVAFERDEAVRGVSCVGVAVRGHDGPVASISLAGRTQEVHLERVAPIVAEAARDVTGALFPETGRRRTRAVPDAVPPSWTPPALDRMLSMPPTGWL
nr:IclR family transcriptional regulator [Rhodococcus rhodnii]